MNWIEKNKHLSTKWLGRSFCRVARTNFSGKTTISSNSAFHRRQNVSIHRLNSNKFLIDCNKKEWWSRRQLLFICRPKPRLSLNRNDVENSFIICSFVCLLCARNAITRIALFFTSFSLLYCLALSFDVGFLSHNKSSVQLFMNHKIWCEHN